MVVRTDVTDLIVEHAGHNTFVRNLNQAKIQKNSTFAGVKPIRFLIFDFDGTLADTADGIVATAQETLRRMGVPDVPPEVIRGTIGLPLGTSLRIAGELPPEKEAEAVATYRELFACLELSRIRIYPGVAETLAAFAAQDIPMAIATSRGPNSLERILSGWGLSGYFPIRATSADGFPAKPAPDMVLALLERLKAPADETLVVGDTTFDIEMGNRAGCRTCAVTYGNHAGERLKTASPTWLIDEFAALRRLL